MAGVPVRRVPGRPGDQLQHIRGLLRDDTAQILGTQSGPEPVSQVEQLREWSEANDEEPDLVTATGGGNDPQVDFGGVLGSCVEWGMLDPFDRDASHCVSLVKAETAALGQRQLHRDPRELLHADCRSGHAAERRRPRRCHRRVPEPIPAGYRRKCHRGEKACGWMGSGGLRVLQAFEEGQLELNKVMAAAAEEAGVRFVRLEATRS